MSKLASFMAYFESSCKGKHLQVPSPGDIVSTQVREAKTSTHIEFVCLRRQSALRPSARRKDEHAP